MEIGSFKLDCAGLASLYSTAAGVGIHDRGNADMGERRSGIHWGVFVVAVPLLIFALYRFAPSAVASLFDPKRHGLKTSPAVPSKPPVVLHHETVNPPPAGPATEPLQSRESAVSNRVDMVGYSVAPLIRDGLLLPQRVVTVFLSDGSRWVGGDGHLQYLGEQFCVVDGRTNWYRPRLPVVAEVGREREPMPVPMPVAAEEPPSAGASSLYIIPGHVSTLTHPPIRSVISSAGASRSY